MKCIIPVAGASTRLLPVTSAVPKFMLPLGTKPLIDFGVAECLDAGILEIIFVCSQEKSEKDFLIKYYGLLTEDSTTYKNTSFSCKFVIQPERKGLGDAIYYGCRDLPLDEKFLVLLPDDIWFINFSLDSKNFYDNPLNLLKESRCLGVATRRVESFEEAKSYGVIQSISPLIIEEKPKIINSNRVIFGRYLLQRQYVEQCYSLDNTKVEIGITSVLNVNKENLKLVVLGNDKFLDCGNLITYTKAWLEFAKTQNIKLSK